jgi:Clostripain family
MHMDKPGERLWTVMVYMVGDYSNLDNNGFADLKEMKKAGSSPQVALLAQFSRGVKNRPTKRYLLTKDCRDGALAGDVVAELTCVETSSSETLTDFIGWSVENFPALHYMLIMWGHGNGADDEKFPASSVPVLHPGDSLLAAQTNKSLQNMTRNRDGSRGIALGYTVVEPQTVDFLDSRRFKRALAAATERIGRKIDILGMDACLMSGIEVCYQVRDSVGFTVAPEGFGPLDGWPYDKIFTELVRKPSLKPEQLARIIVKKYLASYTDYEDVCVTQSICDLDGCPSLVNAVDALATTLITNLVDVETKKAIILSRWQAQSYEGTEYIDLYDFCSLLEQGCDNAEVKGVCQKVINLIGRDNFVVESVYRGAGAQYSYGLSIYFPLTEVSAFYERLDFAQHTHWVEFLREFQKTTRRPERVM